MVARTNSSSVWLGLAGMGGGVYMVDQDGGSANYPGSRRAASGKLGIVWNKAEAARRNPVKCQINY
jgi:hypothetical protein